MEAAAEVQWQKRSKGEAEAPAEDPSIGAAF